MKRILFLTISLSIGYLTKAQQAGDLDTTFAGGGYHLTYFLPQGQAHEEIRNIFTQPDEKIIAVGSSIMATKKYGAVARYNTDGSLDDSFGNGGKLFIEGAPNGKTCIEGGYTLDNGKIILGGCIFYSSQNNSKAFLCRINENGTADMSFGNNSHIIQSNFTGVTIIRSMKMQNDGKIVLGGYYDDNFMAIRYNENGTIDNSFGENGLVVIEVEGAINNSTAEDIAIQDDGKIILVGSYTVSTQSKGLVARLNTDGSLDNSFGTNGIQPIALGEEPDFLDAVDLQKDGKIVLGGKSWDANGNTVAEYSFAIARLNTNGSFDNSFADNGLARFQKIAGIGNYISDLVINPDGFIYACGYTYAHNTEWDVNAILIGLESSGNLISNFGENGIVTTDINNRQEEPQTIILQSDGKILVGANCYDKNDYTFAIMRYTNSISIDITDYEQSSNYIVYPNPVSDKLFVNVDKSEIYSINIYDLQGKLIKNQKNHNILNLNHLKPGFYIVKISTKNKVIMNQITKK